MGWNYLPTPTLQQGNRWSLGMDNFKSHDTCYVIGYPCLKLIHVSKRSPLKLVNKHRVCRWLHVLMCVDVLLDIETLPRSLCWYAVDWFAEFLPRYATNQGAQRETLHLSFRLIQLSQQWKKTENSNECNLVGAWISNHTPSRVWDEINYPFPNFNSCTFVVWEWISNVILHFIIGVITYPC